MTDPAPLPCPFCGNALVPADPGHPFFGWQHPDDGCFGYNLIGPWSTEQDIAAWNRRAAGRASREGMMDWKLFEDDMPPRGDGAQILAWRVGEPADLLNFSVERDHWFYPDDPEEPVFIGVLYWSHWCVVTPPAAPPLAETIAELRAVPTDMPHDEIRRDILRERDEEG